MTQTTQEQISDQETWSYQDALDRLEQIVNGLERDQISVDQLSDQVKEATVLLNKCRQKLTAIEQDVNDALIVLEQTDARPKGVTED